MTPRVALTIAGSDSGGGAGIQADLKTFAALGVYGTSVITAVTAQNTRAVTGVHQLTGPVVGAQLGAVLDDLPVAAVKTGMLGSDEVAAVVAGAARDGRLPNLVVDPVLVSTSGSRLGVVSSVEQLLPYATVATPNLEEASALVGWVVKTPDDMAEAAAEIGARGSAYVVVTGGDLPGDSDAVDAMWSAQGAEFLRRPRVPTRNTHGSGCSFSAAIAARLALGDGVPEALAFAKAYLARAIGGSSRWRLGSGNGPLDHFGWTHEEDAR
jgi:hydroxymethylpyrimidine kinase/phosphomethylpyrimidine kinase